MIQTVCRQKVRNAFSAAALGYDQLTDIHREIGTELITRLNDMRTSGPILDIGMGSGWFTERLVDAFPGLMVVGLDFAPGMIDCAYQKRKGFKIVQADATHLPFKENSFNLITSNLAYQWVQDLPLAFSSCHFCLRKTGKLYLTMFGHDTFEELFTALNVCVGERGGIWRLAKENQVLQALKDAGFTKIEIKTQHRKVSFRDILDLLKWVKGIGANHLPRSFYLGKGLLQKVGRYYENHFKDAYGVYATLEVIWVEARQ